MITSMVDAQNECLFIDGKKVLDFVPYIAEVKLTTTSKGEKGRIEYRYVEMAKLLKKFGCLNYM